MGKCLGCNVVAYKGVKYCCCPKPNPFLPSWVKTLLLAVTLAVPVVLAAKWVVAKGHLENVIKRMEYLAKERVKLEGNMESLLSYSLPSQQALTGSAARRKAALEQLRNWAWRSDYTYEKVVGLRRKKQEMEDYLNMVIRERDSARRDFEIVQNVLKRNQCRLHSDKSVSTP